MEKPIEFSDGVQPATVENNNGIVVVNNVKIAEKYISCVCLSEGMVIRHFPEDEDHEIYLSIFTHGQYQPKPNLLRRFKYAWKILTKGTYFDDELILNEASRDKVVEYLQSIKWEK